MYLEVLVITEHVDNIVFCHYSKIVFENENLAIFAGNSQKDSCVHLAQPHINYCTFYSNV